MYIQYIMPIGPTKTHRRPNAPWGEFSRFPTHRRPSKDKPQDQLALIDRALEHAVLKQLPNLRSACHRMVAAEQGLRDAALRGEFGCVASKAGLRCWLGLPVMATLQLIEKEAI